MYCSNNNSSAEKTLDINKNNELLIVNNDFQENNYQSNN
jgi:hypothetical protein